MTKFDPRSEPYLYLGYPPYQQAYKLLHLHTKKIVISRDVVFHEKHFPFHFNASYAPFTHIFLPTETTPTTSTPYDDVPDVFHFSSPSTDDIITPTTPPDATYTIPFNPSPPLSSPTLSSHIPFIHIYTF